jgi:hypothetical protein
MAVAGVFIASGAILFVVKQATKDALFPLKKSGKLIALQSSQIFRCALR